MWNLDSVYKIFLTLIIIFSGASTLAESKTKEIRLADVKTWNEFKVKMEQEERKDHLKGQAYMISGGLLVIGGIIGYHNAQNSVEKLAYSVSQSLGVGGIGYGAYLSFVDSEQRSFYRSVESSQSLSEENKNEIVRNYVLNKAENERSERITRIVTHSIVGALNVYNGLREEQNDLRQGLIILGGVNILAAISLSFEF